MIDIIICINDRHNKLDKTILSILLQTVKDKVNVYIVDGSNFNYTNIMEKFSDKIRIKVIKVNSNYTLCDMKQLGLESSTSEYVMFLSAGDLLYDCFSLKYMFDIAEEQGADIIYGNVVECMKIASVSDNLFSIVGKMFRREFIVANNIFFDNKSTNHDCSFYGICYMQALKIVSCNYNVIYCERDVRNIDFVSSVVDSINYSIALRHNNSLNFRNYLHNVIRYLYNIYINENSSDEFLSLIHSIEILYLEQEV